MNTLELDPPIEQLDCLLPCPFCGSIPVMLYIPPPREADYMKLGYIICHGCGVRSKQWNDIRTETRFETRNENKTIKIWNTRKL